MLSRRDIDKELGKGINLVPLIVDNIKENSINVTISKYAWTLGEGTVYWNGGKQFSLKKPSAGSPQKTITYKKGNSAIFDYKDEGKNIQYLILLPHQTTIIETEEVIGIGNGIGGAVHSKVGIVAQGIGDTGTMLGPGYCGHLMISLHNITDDVVALKVGTTFVSLTFDYLNTQVVRTSATVSSHCDKLYELGCKIDDQDKDYFYADWKGNITSIRERMIESDEYKSHMKYLKKNFWKEFKKYANKRNIIAIIATIAIFAILLFFATEKDKTLMEPVWVDRFWNVGCSGLVGSFLVGLYRFIKDKK